MLRDTARSDYLFKEHNQILADFSRQRMTKDTVQKLLALAKKAKLPEKIEAMFTGEHINVTEDRPVLHVALRAPREQVGYVTASHPCLSQEFSNSWERVAEHQMWPPTETNSSFHVLTEVLRPAEHIRHPRSSAGSCRSFS